MLKARFLVMTDDELLTIINDVFTYEKTGTLPEESEIRNLAVWIGSNNVLGYLQVCYNVFYEYTRRSLNK